jgi:hypothetical protein
MPITITFNSICNSEEFKVENINGLNPVYFNTLKFDNDFNQSLSTLPNFIKSLEVGEHYTYNLADVGSNLETLITKQKIINASFFPLPCNLKYLSILSDAITCSIGNLPNTLKRLIIDCKEFNHPLELSYTNLEELLISSLNFSQPLNIYNLPSSLKVLHIYSNKFNESLDCLPNNIHTIFINSTNMTQLLTNLPNSLIKLTLKSINPSIHDLSFLPNSLQTLELDFGLDSTILNKMNLNYLPASLQKLYLFNYWGDLNHLPNNLKLLEINFPPGYLTEARKYINKLQR